MVLNAAAGEKRQVRGLPSFRLCCRIKWPEEWSEAVAWGQTGPSQKFLLQLTPVAESHAACLEIGPIPFQRGWTAAVLDPRKVRLAAGSCQPLAKPAIALWVGWLQRSEP